MPSLSHKIMAKLEKKSMVVGLWMSISHDLSRNVVVCWMLCNKKVNYMFNILLGNPISKTAISRIIFFIVFHFLEEKINYLLVRN